MELMFMETRSKEEVAREVEQTRAEAKRATKNATEVWSGRNSVASAWRTTKDKYYDVHDKVADTAHATDEAIRDNLYAALGIALGIGAIVGYFATNKPARSKKQKCC
jgi:ElaB/YqjD/DUF883 family membrane-anchored ribosome-binding protein